MSANSVHDSNGSHPAEARPETKGTARGKKLCPTCEGLDLSVDKFAIYGGGNSRPFNKRASNGSYPGEHSDGSDFLLKSGSRTYKVGTFSGIQTRSETCSFCYLVLKSVEKPASPLETKADVPNHVPNHVSPTPTPTQLDLDVPNPNAICYVNWEVDGRDNDRSSGRKARTRRLHLHWDDKTMKDSYLVFVAPQRLFDFNSDSQGSWEREAFFLGRELKTDGNNQVLIKSWLDQCYQQHGERCSGDQNSEFTEMAAQSYFGVIDVLDMCLKSLPFRTVEAPNKDKDKDPDNISIRIRARYDSSSSSSSDDDEAVEYEPYVALSYVWGLQKNYTTDISNIRVHQQQGSLETFLGEIPLVIRDAMSLVRRLGLRYLWVDSLCIVQNSKRSWNLNSRVMNLIYGNAFLTICAADGSDAWFGLKALDSSAHSTSQHIEECVPGVRLMVSQLAETGIEASVWNTRA